MDKRQTVPAHPEFALIVRHHTERDRFECHPIVAWELVFLGEETIATVPVTLLGNHRELVAVRYPNGTIYVDRTFPKGAEMEALAYVDKRMDDHDRARERAGRRA